VIRDVEILHEGGPASTFERARLRIERAHVVHTGAPAKGANPSAGAVNLSGYASSGAVINHVKLERGSSGVYLLESPAATLSFVEGHDFRGPMPRGQLLQLDKSPDAVLEDFSCENPVEESWPEDNVSIYQSSNVTVRRGLIIGNNSPSGVGVMFELSDGVTHGGLAEDVDTLDMGNGSFSGYPARDVVFRRTRARDNHCTGRRARSAAVERASGRAPDSQNLSIEDRATLRSAIRQHVGSERIFRDRDDRGGLHPRQPIREKFCWE
jgi:hypothetical protein